MTGVIYVPYIVLMFKVLSRALLVALLYAQVLVSLHAAGVEVIRHNHDDKACLLWSNLDLNKSTVVTSNTACDVVIDQSFEVIIPEPKHLAVSKYREQTPRDPPFSIV
ncbi:MAG: hypothetical protein VW683_08255 [Betaproteobacteria bacterium]